MAFAIRMQRQFRHLVGFLRPFENPIGIFEAFLACAGFGRIGIADIFLADDPSACPVIISRNPVMRKQLETTRFMILSGFQCRAIFRINQHLRRDLFRFLVFGGDRVREGDDPLRERNVEAGGFDRALQRFLDLPVGGPLISGGDSVSDSAHHCKDISHVDRTKGENDRKRQPIKEFRFY